MDCMLNVIRELVKTKVKFARFVAQGEQVKRIETFLIDDIEQLSLVEAGQCRFDVAHR